jgi:hypothetical protein
MNRPMASYGNNKPKVVSLCERRRRIGIAIDLSDPSEADKAIGLLALTLCGNPRLDSERILSFADELGLDPHAIYRNFLYRNTFAGLNNWTN